MKKLYFLSTLMLLTAVMLPQNVKAQVSVWDGTYTPWTNGTGTEADPFLIENAQQLAYLAYRVNNGLDAAGGHVSNNNLHYKLMTDVNLNGSQSFQWAPIGYWNSNTDYYCFGGHFDGNNHTISGLYINSSANRVGFFGYTDGATIKNLSVSGDTVATTSSYSGGIVGYANLTNIKDCNNSCNISSKQCLGGIVGETYSTSTILNCYNTGNVLSPNSYNSTCYCGGIVGHATYGTLLINNCYNIGSLVNTKNNSSYTSVYVYSGGIIGGTGGEAIITNCYNRGNITSSSYYGVSHAHSGGIIGYMYSNSSVCNCYNTGTILGNCNAGGIVGTKYQYSLSTNVLNSYYVEDCNGNNGYGGFPMSSAAMKTVEFVSIINNGSCAYEMDVVPFINQGYPILTMVVLSANTLNATNVTQSHATLNGILTVMNDSIVSFGYRYKPTTTTAYSFIPCSTFNDTVTTTLSGLQPSTSYQFSIYMLSAGCDTTFGTNKTFTTSSISTISDYATNVTQTHATLNGSFTIGDASISAQGFEYKKSADTAYQIVNVSGEGSISETIAGLTPNTQYVYRSFCTAIGCETVYGATKYFTTSNVSVTTNPATSLTESSATLNGSIIMGDATVTNKGFEYRAVGDNTYTTINATSGTDIFSASLYGLPVNTDYEYRAFVNIAENTETYYGTTQTFEVSWLNADTILIYDADMLQWVSDRCNTGTTFEGKYIKLMNNIVLPLNQPNNMTSIGVYPSYPFKGTFDGNGMLISNLYIDHPNTEYQGFFGYTLNANLYEVGLVNITASGRNYTGGMVAYAANTYMRDCYVNGGSLFALSYCGGLVGYQSEGTNSIISGCYNTCTVSGTSYVGGLVGFSNYATVRNSYVAASVAAQGSAVGAIIGGANEVLMYNCYFSTSITGQSDAIGEHNFRDGEGLSNEEMQSTQFVATLNQGLVRPVWKSDYATPINNGFPILIWQYSDVETCDAPTNPNAVVTGTSATLSWSGGGNASYYVVEYGVLGGETHSENTSNHQLTLHNLQSTNYFWRVKSVCSFGESNFVNGNNITVGIDDYNGFNFKVYPNPTSNIVNVECKMGNGELGDVIIQLYDVYGKLLGVNVVGANDYSPIPQATAQIDLSRYANGVYFIKLVSGSGQYMATRKIVKR